MLRLFDPQIARGLVARLRVGTLLRRFPERQVWAAFMFVNGFVTIGLLSALAVVARTPFVFPSLGPTAFLFFVDPSAPSASPRNSILGHAVGICCGYASLVLFGLENAGPAMSTGVTVSRALAAALSLAVTGALMVLLKTAHPPAGATTLIISLGVITRPAHLAIVEVAVALLTLQAIAVNRLAGLDYPLWSRRAPPASHGPAEGDRQGVEGRGRD